MANEFLRLPAGLTAADYSPETGSLLDYTPPNVKWQAPLASTGSNVFANYVKSHDDLLRDYNRRLARPSGKTGALPTNRFGAPISMATYGYKHWSDHGQGEGRTLTKAPGIWGDPGRSPYISYYNPGRFVEEDEGMTSDELETMQDLNEAIALAGTSQVIEEATPSDQPTAQEDFEKEVEESEDAPYPYGHTTFAGWDMDDRNPTGHWWRLENAAWMDPETCIRKGPKTWNGTRWV